MVDTVTTTTAVVPVQSALISKINWAQVISLVAMGTVVLTGGKLNITPDQQVAVVATIGVITNVVTYILRTWFNGSVNPASLPEGTPTKTVTVPK